MKENYELIMHIYEDAQMACYTLCKLIEDLKEKDNKIKKTLEDILKEYTYYENESKKILEENKIELKEKGLMSKMMASKGIKKEVKKDNSDSAIAELLIQGISMGSLDMDKKISSYEKDTEKKYIKFAKDFLKFQEKTISNLKKYL